MSSQPTLEILPTPSESMERWDAVVTPDNFTLTVTPRTIYTIYTPTV